MRKVFRLTIGFIWLTLSAPGLLSAQSDKTTLEGIVFDSTGGILARIMQEP